MPDPTSVCRRVCPNRLTSAVTRRTLDPLDADDRVGAGDDGVDVYAPERHQQILATARLDGRVDVNRLAEQLDVTPETIRRDLTVLERHGLVRRVHGGAIPVERLGFE